MTPKEFFKRWAQGIKDSTPAQLLQVKMVSHIGSIIGILFATFFISRNGLWFFFILFGFMVVLQSVEFIGARQRYKQIVQIQRQIELDQLEKLTEDKE